MKGALNGRNNPGAWLGSAFTPSLIFLKRFPGIVTLLFTKKVGVLIVFFLDLLAVEHVKGDLHPLRREIGRIGGENALHPSPLRR